jgi:aspartyl-tRNA(Asn)/glutamyl-tRNA(Gln) amidotransferase subunit A
MIIAAANEICRMDAATLAGQITAKSISPVEVAEAVLARMERLEPHLHAFCTPTPELALTEARRVEVEIMAGRAAGPLAGIPVSHKDLILTKGVRTTSGSLAYKDFVPDEDDVVVQRLRAAGAVMIGKTNAPEFGYSAVGHNAVFETTRNPWNTTLTSGGSSAASAQSQRALMAAVRSAYRRPSADCTVSSRPSAAYLCTQALEMNAIREYRVGNRSSILGR